MSNPNVSPIELGKECMHVTYCTSKDGKDDALFVKEYTHYDDGSAVPNLRMIENMERSFWTTKPGRRDHVDKLQWEKIENCDERRCRHIDLLRTADLALGGSGYVKRKQFLFASPYLYGCGVKPQSLVKYAYSKKYPDIKSKLARVAYMDTETEEVRGTKEIIMGVITYKDRAMLAVTREFFGMMDEEVINQKFFTMLKEKIEPTLLARGLSVTLILVDNAGDVTNELFKKAHEWQPDFVAFWNMDFDIGKMLEALEKYGYDASEVFSDPRVPDKYKFFKYVQGKEIKTTHDGKTSSINPEQRWHKAECPATFFLIDAMTLYYRVRMAAGMEDGYSLDAVLERNLNINKLTIPELDHLSGLDWHKAMQRDYKFEYAVYCIFDGISGELLDEHTGDVAVKLPATCKYSDFNDFKSGPTRIADEMHFHCLENGYVIGVIEGDARDENDAHVLKAVDWIITLPAYMGNSNLGLDFVENK